jgi:hypothetical protein
VTVLHLGTRKQKIRWLSAAVEVDNDVWGKENSHIEDLMNQVLGRTIVDVMMMFQIYPRGGTISGRRDVGPHGVNL